jgi:hypothetical protein
VLQWRAVDVVQPASCAKVDILLSDSVSHAQCGQHSFVLRVQQVIVGLHGEHEGLTRQNFRCADPHIAGHHLACKFMIVDADRFGDRENSLQAHD